MNAMADKRKHSMAIGLDGSEPYNSLCRVKRISLGLHRQAMQSTMHSLRSPSVKVVVQDAMIVQIQAGFKTGKLHSSGTADQQVRKLITAAQDASHDMWVCAKQQWRDQRCQSTWVRSTHYRPASAH